MSQKPQLQKHIDGLCDELGITDKQYSSNTTIGELQSIIDELESKLPDGDAEQDEEPELGVGDDLIDEPESKLPDGDAELNEDPAPESGDEIIKAHPANSVAKGEVETSSNDVGDIEVKAKLTVILKSHGKTVKIVKGASAFIEKSAALDAVEEGVAAFLSK
ncbi:MAG: hypothetical protein ACRC0U_01930 [Vibrio sp.]